MCFKIKQILTLTAGFEGHPLRKDFPLTVRIHCILKNTLTLILVIGLHRSTIWRRTQASCIRTATTDPSLPVCICLWTAYTTLTLSAVTLNHFHRGSKSEMGHLGRDQAILNSFLRQNLRSQPRNSSRPSHLNLSSRNTNRSSMQKRTQSEYKYKITCMNRTPRQDVITRLSTTDVVYMLCHSSVRRSFHDSESLYRYFIELHIPGWIVWPLCWKSLENESVFTKTTNVDVDLPHNSSPW